MGNKTEMFFRAELREDVHPAVVDALVGYSRGESRIPDGLPEHEFFRAANWRTVLSMSDFVTPTNRVPVQFWIDEGNPDQWRLIIHCSAKNYDREFEKFLDWIMPYVDAQPGEFLGYTLYDERGGQPSLISYPASDAEA
ncbi:hypothetical protein BH09ACT7_BH09ACT7_54300 [soil metagenome]